MSTVIHVENISKRYRLGQTHGGSIANRIHRAAGKMFGRRAPRAALKVSAASSPSQVDDHGDFWALRDVSLSVEAGEVVGLIGRNGAGKSTLLKILSRIVTPTAGRAELRGRVASLLEVGTGFHPELTGRENVFLNGAILGMTKAEIRNRFQEIVDFSEIGTFIDTPVKRYSSGMYVRLAFAVAAHIDPEILIVDEVLAVGDLEFQRKCLGKIADISGTGRTVLFVSHNVGAVRRLCTRCVVLDSGAVAIDGTTAAALERYLAKDAACNGVATWDQGISNPGIDEFRFLGVRLLDEMGHPSGHLSSNGNFNLEIQYCIDRDVQDCRVGFQINAADGTPVCELYDTDVLSRAPVRKAGRKTLSCTFRCPELANGRYVISLNAGIPFTRNLAYVEGAIAFEVANSNNGGFMSQLPRSGLICPTAEWRTQEVA